MAGMYLVNIFQAKCKIQISKPTITARIIAIMKPALKASSIRPQPESERLNAKQIKGKTNFFIAAVD